MRCPDVSGRNGVDKTYFSATEGAEYLGLPPQTLANWRSQGRGPRYAKLGSRVVYGRADLKGFFEANIVSDRR